jgi:adenylate kinase
VVRRITGRRSCAHGHVFHLDFDPPAVAGVCDVCGEALDQRTDDTEPVVRKRLEVYREETEPLLGFYREQNMLRDVDGVGPLEDVLASLVKALL